MQSRGVQISIFLASSPLLILNAITDYFIIIETKSRIVRCGTVDFSICIIVNKCLVWGREYSIPLPIIIANYKVQWNYSFYLTIHLR